MNIIIAGGSKEIHFLIKKSATVIMIIYTGYIIAGMP